MGKKKQTKSIGVQIALQFYPEGTMDHAVQAVKLSRLINAAINRVVREAVLDCLGLRHISVQSVRDRKAGMLAKKYGIRKL